jgi:hypothetical protein
MASSSAAASIGPPLRSTRAWISAPWMADVQSPARRAARSGGKPSAASLFVRSFNRAMRVAYPVAPRTAVWANQAGSARSNASSRSGRSTTCDLPAPAAPATFPDVGIGRARRPQLRRCRAEASATRNRVRASLSWHGTTVAGAGWRTLRPRRSAREARASYWLIDSGTTVSNASQVGRGQVDESSAHSARRGQPGWTPLNQERPRRRYALAAAWSRHTPRARLARLIGWVSTLAPAPPCPPSRAIRPARR